MLNLAVRNTGKLIREKSKSENVRLGRLFTKKDTARLMAGMLTLDNKKNVYTILDPGAGTGILAAAAIEEVCKNCPQVSQIFITCYENDTTFLPQLHDNLERIRKKCRHDYGIKLYVTVYEENYLTDSKNHYTVSLLDVKSEDKFDLIICNPPLDLIDKYSPEAEAVGGVTQLKTAAAYLFCRTAARHLEDGGQLVIMLPTIASTAAGLSSFRKEMADTLSLCKMHLFVGKQKNQKRAVPLKKSFILNYAKAPKPATVEISTSTDNGANPTVLPAVPYSFVVDSEDGTLTLPKSIEDTKIVKHISDLPETLAGLGLKMSTGLVLDSRCEGQLFTEPMAGTIPLLRPSAIKGGQIRFPQPVKRQYLAPVNKKLIQKNKNLVIIKRVPAKSDERFINAAIYMAAQLPSYKYISTHNKINFIDTVDKEAEISPRLAFGLFALLNSTIYDRYISIMSKSKQINSKEMRDLPLPPRHIIENIGMRLMSARQTTVAVCDQIVNPTLHIIEKR